ncbi:MAG: efflux transporter outer membrane subunit [Bacteroidaceae bacterium]|nr:efflux transporter outer membrane subunit [Bacteroidaceae bacterium]
MKKQVFIIAFATLGLSSCGLYRNYDRPSDIQTDGLYGTAQTGNTEQSLGAKAWREFFTDPQLQALIERGLAQNLNMRQLDLQIQEAQEYLKCSKLAYIPSLAIAPQGQLSSFDWSKPLKFYTVPLSASWQIGSIGSLRNAKKTAEVGVEQTRVAQQAVQQALVANIANIYYSLCMLDAQLAISEQTAKNWRESVELTRKLMAAGRSNKAAVAQSEANCYSVEANLLDLREGIIEAENALCTILGEAPHHIERSSLSAFQAPAAIETGIPLALLQNRPDVRQAELQLASKFYAVNSAKASFYPALTLSGTLGFTNNGSSIELSPGKWIWNALGQLAQPIFQNGRLRAQKRVAEMQQEEAKMAFQQSLVAAGNEVNTALVKLQTAQGKRQFIDGQIRALNDAVQATEALYKDNVSHQVNYLNVLTAQTGLLSAQLGQLANQYAVISATIELYQALGGGSLREN